MKTASVETGVADLPRQLPIKLSVCRRRPFDRIDVMPAATEHKERLAVQEELLAADFKLANAKTLEPRLHNRTILHQLDLRRIQVRMDR